MYAGTEQAAKAWKGARSRGTEGYTQQTWGQSTAECRMREEGERIEEGMQRHLTSQSRRRTVSSCSNNGLHPTQNGVSPANQDGGEQAQQSPPRPLVAGRGNVRESSDEVSGGDALGKGGGREVGREGGREQG